MIFWRTLGSKHWLSPYRQKHCHNFSISFCVPQNTFSHTGLEQHGVEWTTINGLFVNWSEGCHLFECGDVAGDVLHSNGVLHCQSVALALYSSSVDDDPGICSQTWTNTLTSKNMLRSPICIESPDSKLFKYTYSVKSKVLIKYLVAPAERVKTRKVIDATTFRDLFPWMKGNGDW